MLISLFIPAEDAKRHLIEGAVGTLFDATMVNALVSHPDLVEFKQGIDGCATINFDRETVLAAYAADDK